MVQDRRIALLFDKSLGYCRDVIRGIVQYAQNQPDWLFRLAPSAPSTLAPLRQWEPHGIIAHLFDPSLADSLAMFDVPVINTTSTLRDERFPLVEVDHVMVGEMAAEHFLQLGYRNFGFFGSSWTDFSLMREEGFRKKLASHGLFHSSCYEEFLPASPAEDNWSTIQKHIENWLKSLNFPTAVFASNDVPATQLIAACRRLSIRSPQDIPILAVDNDEFECNLSRPNISSIAIPAERIGRESAHWLQRMLNGEEPPSRPLLFPPTRVVSRMSTDANAVDDEELLSFINWVRHEYARDWDIEEICEHLGIGRRTLERKMRRVLSRTALDEIRLHRLESAKVLLTESEQPVKQIARLAGFQSSKGLCSIFKKHVGCTPLEFRMHSNGTEARGQPKPLKSPSV